MLNRFFALPIALALALVATQSDAKAAFTATYVLTGQPGTEAGVSATSNPAGTTFSALTRSPDLTSTTSGNNAMNSANFSNSTTYPGATGSYYTFTITPTAGSMLSLSELDFYFQRSGTGPFTIDLRSSRDSYGSSLGTAVIPTSPTVNEEVFMLNLSNITSAVTFRVVAYGATSTAGTLRITDSQGSSSSAPAAPPGSACSAT